MHLSAQRPSGANPLVILAIVVVGLLAVGVIAWAAMPMFGPMPGMDH